MTVVREVVARFGIDYDRHGAMRADRDLDKLVSGSKRAGRGLGAVESAVGGLTRTLGYLGLAAGVGGAAAGFYHMIESASDAVEQLNVINASFGQSADSVMDWSKTMADELGRSEYTLQSFAARLGAIVSPAFADMGEKGRAEAASISTSLSKLSVDLSSFFNTTEEDALIALRAGLTGESEPLKRYGVDLTQQGMADATGVDIKSFNKLSRAEKMQARFEAIMVQTANAQGDAARTANEYANASRAASDAIRDVTTQIGMRLLPYMKAGAVATRDWARDMQDWVGEAGHLEAVALTLGAALAAVGIMTVGAWGPMFATVALVGGAMFALWTIIDSIMVGMEGGKSVIGDWLDELMGVRDVLPLFKSTIEVMAQDLAEFVYGDSQKAVDSFVEAWTGGLKRINAAMKNAFGFDFGFLPDPTKWSEKLKDVGWDIRNAVTPGIARPRDAKVIEGYDPITTTNPALHPGGWTGWIKDSIGYQEGPNGVTTLPFSDWTFGPQESVGPEDMSAWRPDPGNYSAPMSSAPNQSTVNVQTGDVNITVPRNMSSAERGSLRREQREAQKQTARDIAAAVEIAP